MMCAEPRTAPCAVHGNHGFPVRGTSGHPHAGHSGHVHEAISLPCSRGSPQTPPEGQGTEEDTATALLPGRLLGDNQCALPEQHHGRAESKAVVLERRRLQNQHPVLPSWQGRAALQGKDRLCCRDQLLQGHSTPVNLPLNRARHFIDLNGILVKQSEKHHDQYYLLIHPQCWKRGLLKRRNRNCRSPSHQYIRQLDLYTPHLLF